MKRILISSLALVALTSTWSNAQQKSAQQTPKPTTNTKPKPATKVDIVGAAVSKDAKGSVVPLANKEPFKFYTNPDKELLTIEFNDPAFKNSEIAISTNDGKPIKQVQLEGNQTKVNVNTQRWDNGIYVVILTQHTTQQTIMQKIVLNR
jgi:Secretion system C-terminal sorting domain